MLAIVAAVSAAAFAAGVLFVAGKAHDLASALVDTFKSVLPSCVISSISLFFHLSRRARDRAAPK